MYGSSRRRTPPRAQCLSAKLRSSSSARLSYILQPPKDSELIFFGEPGRDGKRRPYVFNPVWLNIKRSVGLADVRFHDLRHEAVSRFVEAGFSDQEVSAISGHKSMQMLKRYTHLRAEDLVNRLDSRPRRHGENLAS